LVIRALMKSIGSEVNFKIICHKSRKVKKKEKDSSDLRNSLCSMNVKTKTPNFTSKTMIVCSLIVSIKLSSIKLMRSNPQKMMSSLLMKSLPTPIL
uniref:Uncharacterized protein n=1 Tax=Amphimedon queenslandica TaxID=400682 RepID=A0A1X7V2S9_AMPQE